jgi:recombination protein RecA
MYGHGISREGALLDLAVEMAIAKKSGAWFTYEGEQMGQGRENAKNFLHDHPEIMMDMEQKIRAIAGLNGDVEAEVEFSEKDEQPIELD